MILLILLALTGSPAPAELADMAAEQYLTEHFAEASELWEELLLRMPHRGRMIYNLAASRFMQDSPSISDSLLSIISSDVCEDTLTCAVDLTDLALAIKTVDYAAVESSVNTLRSSISDGISLECERIGLEAGLNWLEHHEPPDDQNEDQQDQNEDQQDQNEDQQDQSEDQQDQNEDQQDQNEDQQDQSEDQQQPPPQIDEMTEEQAQAILDLVEENTQSDDSTAAGKAGYPSGPIW